MVTSTCGAVWYVDLGIVIGRLRLSSHVRLTHPPCGIRKSTPMRQWTKINQPTLLDLFWERRTKTAPMLVYRSSVSTDRNLDQPLQAAVASPSIVYCFTSFPHVGDRGIGDYYSLLVAT